jgi:hypothetical protein
MHAALWLYLAILAVVPANADTVELKVQDLSTAMGLPEGTIRSWLGHLRKHRYLAVRSMNGLTRIRVKRHVPVDPPKEPPPERFFTVQKLERALGEAGYRKLLDDALATYPDPAVKRALAAALAVPAAEIRRSRTALFLYLLKRHAQDTPTDDPRS